MISFGFIPEFVGRIPVVALASELKEDELSRVLTEPKYSIVKQYVALFDQSGVIHLLTQLQLRFHPDAISRIAVLARKKKTGARGLRRIMEQVLQAALYEYPGTGYKYILVLPDCIDKKVPVLAFREDEHDLATEFLEKTMISM